MRHLVFWFACMFGVACFLAAHAAWPERIVLAYGLLVVLFGLGTPACVDLLLPRLAPPHTPNPSEMLYKQRVAQIVELVPDARRTDADHIDHWTVFRFGRFRASINVLRDANDFLFEKMSSVDHSRPGKPVRTDSFEEFVELIKHARDTGRMRRQRRPTS